MGLPGVPGFQGKTVRPEPDSLAVQGILFQRLPELTRDNAIFKLKMQWLSLLFEIRSSCPSVPGCLPGCPAFGNPHGSAL